MANRTYDKPETAIKGLVEIPFQFTVNASGVVTAQYPSAATVTIAKDGTTASQYNLTFADKFNAFIACTAQIIKGAAGSTLDGKIEPIVMTAGNTTNVINLQSRLSSTGAAANLASAVVSGVVYARNSSVTV
jgi:hypothetical protein